MITSTETQRALRSLIEARHPDPFAVLGPHAGDGGSRVRVFIPNASAVTIVDGAHPMAETAYPGLFEWCDVDSELPRHYRISWRVGGQSEHIAHDPYTFPAQIPDYDLQLFAEGRHRHAYRFLGAHQHEVDGIGGVLFAVWAPNAERVSVVGGFNAWDGRRHPMRLHRGKGVWELFIPDLGAGEIYKYEIRNRDTGDIFLKSDPYGQRFERRPSTASIVEGPPRHAWQDADWLTRRQQFDWQHKPISIYEVHLGSWRRGPEGEFLDYRELAEQLIPYVLEMGFSQADADHRTPL